MKVTIANGILHIEMPVSTPTPSKSGKSLIVATTSGNIQTPETVNGKQLVVSVNAYIPR